MAFVKVRIPRTSQPQDACGIDWSNPISNGLVDWQLPAAHRLANQSGAGVVATQQGKALKGNGSSSYFYRNAGPVELAETTSYTLLARVIGTPSADSRLYSFGSSTNATPILAIGAGTSNASKLRLWYRAQNNSVSTGDSVAPLFEAATAHTGALIISGATISAYIDGVFDSSATIPSNNGVGIVDRVAVGCLLRSTASSHSSAALMLGLCWARALSPADIKALSDNPWQIFEPEELTSWVPDSASSGNTYTITPSGGIVFTATTASVKNRVYSSSGVIEFSGSSAVTFTPAAGSNIYTISPTGSIVFTGNSLFSKEYVITTTGTISYTGTSAFIHEHTYSISGGMSFSGSAVQIKTKIVSSTGSIYFTGTAPITGTNPTVLVASTWRTLTGMGV